MAYQFQVDTGGTLTTSLTAYWKLDEATGTRTDVWAGHNLTLGTEPNSTTGKVNNAVDFTAASSEYLTAGNDASFDNPGDISAAFWIKGSTTSAQMIIGKTNDTSVGTNPGWQLSIGVWAAGTVGWGFVKNGTNYSQQSGSTNIMDSAWHSIVATRTGNTINFYLDGNSTPESVDQGDAGTMNNCANAVSFSMGRSEDSSARWYANFALDEVGVWSKVLSSQERADIYNAGNGQTMVPGTSASPSLSPSVSPSKSPSISPSASSSISPSPSFSPSASPSISSSISPSKSPSISPSASPSISPSASPSVSPSLSPSPSFSPSVSSSVSPSMSQSISPSNSPSLSPSIAPSGSKGNFFLLFD